MSFPYDAYYLIEARPALAERLRGRTDDDFLELLMEPVVIRNREGGNTTFLAAQHTGKVKLLFLVGLADYDVLATPAGFEALFETDRISIALFDRFWTARRFQLDAEADQLEAGLRAVLDRVESTGDPQVDGYLDRLVETAEPSVEPTRVGPSH